MRQLCYFNMLSSVCQELFYKFFSNFFNICSFQQLFEFIITLSLCQELFLLSFLKKERRRRDLNPRAAINDLLPFQGSPFGQLGYFSIKNGEGGIRTHAPLRTNGFQDRLVMTTSIPLHLFTCLPLPYHLSDKIDNIIVIHYCQHFF